MPDFSHADTLLGVLESVSEPVVSYNESMRIAWMNPAAEIFLGISIERARGLSCIDIFPDDLPCRNNCPVRKALREWETVALLTEGLATGDCLLTAVPLLQDEGDRRVLEIIQGSFMEIPKAPFRSRILEELNRAFGMDEAAPVLVNAMREVAGPVGAGVYSIDGNGFTLVSGLGVRQSMERIPHLDMISHSPLYVRSSSVFPDPPEKDLPDELSILPIYGPDGPEGLLLCCTIPDSDGRERLEELQSVMSIAMRRFMLAEGCRRHQG